MERPDYKGKAFALYLLYYFMQLLIQQIVIEYLV